MADRPASQYAFEQPGQSAAARFDTLAALYDESTQRHLLARGISSGWRCLDIGAGGGTVARWLSERVGPTGHVLATDLNIDALERVRAPNLEVRRHDIVREPLPENAFDLIHTRLVLVHLPERDDVITRLVRALKPGGWLVAEEFDARSMLPNAARNPAETESPLILAIQQMLMNHGADPSFGRRLADQLRAAGLIEFGAEGRVLLWQGGSVGIGIHRTNAQHLRQEIVGSGLLTSEEFDRELARFDDPNFMVPSPIMWTAWGRKA